MIGLSNRTFQFQYGTIKSILRTHTESGYASFNSSMVRLKVTAVMAVVSYLLFQFQYGTIKSQFRRYPCHSSPYFQFQYGTIKRLQPLQPWLLPLPFNSSMVRLKVSWKIWDYRDTRNFQFQYGTIKSSEFDRCHCLAVPFQFQYGTIKRYSSFSTSLSHSSFNSSMVRLKVPFVLLLSLFSHLSIPVWYD